MSAGGRYLRRHTCTETAASRVRQQSFWLSSGARWPERLVLVSLQGIKGTWASQQQGLSSDPWEATPPLIWKVTFSHSNIKRHHIHSTQVTRWSLFQRPGWEEWDKEWVRFTTRNNLRCLQIGMLHSGQVRLFKSPIKTLAVSSDHQEETRWACCFYTGLYKTCWMWINRYSASYNPQKWTKRRDNCAIKTTPVIFAVEFSFHSSNDTVRGQWWWQLITLECQQRFLGIWAAVPQSILACSSSGVGKKEKRAT